MINFEQFNKYSKPGPRYTSYPTALEFHEKFTHEDYENILKKQDSSRPLSLYFHLPFCRSACYFCGCNTIFTSKEEKKDRYIEYLLKEMELLSKVLDTKREVLQLHFGGGTPTFFSAKQLEKIIKAIKKHFAFFSPEAEISCEIDPRFLNSEQLEVLINNGFNRISYGVQDFDENIQKIIHRIQPFQTTKNAINLARSMGIKSINMDLIYGLPMQTLQSFKSTLQKALELSPDRFAVFNYAHVPWLKKSMRKFDETTIPSPNEKLEILKYSIDFFTKNGYKMIGMDHFAKPEDELFRAIDKGQLHRNFQGYTTKGGADLIGIGVTSIGEGVSHYAQNQKDLKAYEQALDEGHLPIAKGIILNAEDRLRKAVIMELMSNFKLNIKAIEEKFNIDFFMHFQKELEQLKEFEKENLLSLDEKSINVSQTGTLLIRNIAMPFDEYSFTNANSKRFSKTV